MQSGADANHEFQSAADSIVPELPDACIEEFLAEAAPPADWCAALSEDTFRSQLLSALLGQLFNELKKGNARGALYSDMLIMAVIAEMSALASGELAEPLTRDFGLDPHSQDRIAEYVCENLKRNITTLELCDLVGMSPMAFTRSCKETYGLTPYQYVLLQKQEHARNLIEYSTLSLAEIAYRSGFSSQSHMTDTFRCRLGSTPGAMRRTLAHGRGPI